jgi:tetratricopeptide (TPR) repeat protein
MIFRLTHRLPLLLALLISASQTCLSQGREEQLAQLQNDFALRYMEPEAHMALARYYLEHGSRMEAFFTLEAARRGRFEEAVFDRAFQLMFEGFDNSKATEEKLLVERGRQPNSVEVLFQLADIYISRSDWSRATQYLLEAIKKKPNDFRFTSGLAEVLRAQEKMQDADRIVQRYVRDYPESRDGYVLRAEAVEKRDPAQAKRILGEGITKFPDDGGLLFHLGALMQRDGDLEGAEATFVKAATLAPKSVDIQSWVGRFFFKVKKDSDQALPYYLNAYFLSPHAYETEFVESRLRQIYFERARVKFEDQMKAKRSLIEMLGDPDPIVVSMTLGQMGEKWLAGYVDPLVAMMGHDDQGVRWEATQLLKNNVDSSFDQRLKDLLKDNNLRRRGLAAYIAVWRWKRDSFGFMDELLHEKAELLRFDALSALMLEGGVEGKQRALAHSARETNPGLKKLIESSKAQPNSSP